MLFYDRRSETYVSADARRLLFVTRHVSLMKDSHLSHRMLGYVDPDKLEGWTDELHAAWWFVQLVISGTIA